MAGTATERILFIGDVVGRSGRRLLKERLPGIRREFATTLVVANGENASGGVGIGEKSARELFAAGVDVITTGNHVWDVRGSLEYVPTEPRILRPLNYPPGTPGRGYGLFNTSSGREVMVVNLHGRVFINTNFDCPFRAMERVLQDFEGAPGTPILVDLHGEATSEKIAFGHAFDGRVAAVVGTHTHVQTNDARLLPRGTAYVTDLGMTGPADGVIGVKADIVVERFYSQIPSRFKVASGPRMLNAALLTMGDDDDACSLREIAVINRRYDP